MCEIFMIENFKIIKTSEFGKKLGVLNNNNCKTTQIQNWNIPITVVTCIASL